VNVWQLLFALLGHAFRGRERHPLYAVVNDLSDAAQEEVDEQNLAVTQTWAPHFRQGRFVVVAVRPEKHG